VRARVFEDPHSLARRETVLVLNENAVACYGLLAPRGILVSDARQAGSQTQVGEERVRPVDQVFLQYVLLVLIGVAAMRHELDPALSFEGSILARTPPHREPKRRKRTHRRASPKNAARP
jgi:hypothetical protein